MNTEEFHVPWFQFNNPSYAILQTRVKPGDNLMYPPVINTVGKRNIRYTMYRFIYYRYQHIRTATNSRTLPTIESFTTGMSHFVRWKHWAAASAGFVSPWLYCTFLPGGFTMIFLLGFVVIAYLVKKMDFAQCCRQIEDKHDEWWMRT